MKNRLLQNSLKHRLKAPYFAACVFLLGAVWSASVVALESDSNIDLLQLPYQQHQHQDYLAKPYAQNAARRPQSKQERIGKSEIVRKVKQRFDAQVLRISLNKSGTAYRVRVLMPDGRVRVIVMEAYR